MHTEQSILLSPSGHEINYESSYAASKTSMMARQKPETLDN
jgi:hypothetical protein